MEPESNLREPTRERILRGAVEAVARHGLAKLEMGDVSESAGVSRGTLYRYFSSREELLDTLTVREAQRFWDHCVAALEGAPEEERLQLLLLHATRAVREHAALQRMLETDPALVLRGIQKRFSSIRSELRRLVGPLLSSTQPVRSGTVAVDQLVDWMTRLMITAFLIPPPDSEEMAAGLTAVHQLLCATPEAGGPEATRKGRQAAKGKGI